MAAENPDTFPVKIFDPEIVILFNVLGKSDASPSMSFGTRKVICSNPSCKFATSPVNDEKLPDKCVRIASAHPKTLALGALFGVIQVEKQ